MKDGAIIRHYFCKIESSLPEPVLDYVLRKCESVVVDAATRARFAADHYLRQHRASSILCLPLLHQATLVGALHLENHLASGVFTAARIMVQKLIASLATSALENSRLYRVLQEREARATRPVDANLIGIYVVDLRGPILESNDAYLRMLDTSAETLGSGRLRWTDLTPPEWHDADRQRVEKVKKAGRLLPFEKEFFRRDGTREPVLMGVARFKEPRTQAVVFALDMSKRGYYHLFYFRSCDCQV